jgi:hypothetical protein
MHMAPRMFVFLFAVMILLSEIVVADAAQKDTGATPSQKSNVASVVWEKARTNGTVRVIVDLNVAGWVSKKLSKEAELAQRHKVADAQRLVLGELAGTRYKINRQFEMVPGLAMEVGPDALAVLERSPHVLKVSEDTKLSPSMERFEVIKTPEKKETAK